MTIKLTKIAQRDLDGLDRVTRLRTIASLRDLESAKSSHKPLRLSGVKDEVRIAPLQGSMRAIYRLTDIDQDGEPDVVVLQLVNWDRAKRLTDGTKARLMSVPSADLRLGSELVEELRSTD